VGNYPLSLYAVAGSNNKRFASLPKPEQERIEWGMRAVHEIQRVGALEKILLDFGYATPAVQVHNYWEDNPAVQVNNESIKWLALVNKTGGGALFVLASWAQEDVEATLSLNETSLGIPIAGKSVLDAETNESVAAFANQPFSVKLAGPWGVRVLKIKGELR
jgi:hypothetical protein